MHNCMFRQILSPDDEAEEAREDAIEKFFVEFKTPTTAEDFDEIVQVKFIVSFRNADEAKIYGMRLLER
ncbi:hypothetical protein AAVH_13488 [Aphelenchoides avenae]|nr:hypothetical protein AAVH_13488 [Aphelenchus avenae]